MAREIPIPGGNRQRRGPSSFLPGVLDLTRKPDIRISRVAGTLSQSEPHQSRPIKAFGADLAVPLADSGKPLTSVKITKIETSKLTKKGDEPATLTATDT